jgi:hypothetical protein
MKFTRIRWFRALAAAMFLWSNVAVAAHACIAAIATQSQGAVGVQGAILEHEGCAHERSAPPANSDQALCFAHCLHSEEATTQKISIDAPCMVSAPVLLVLRASAQASTAAPVLTLAVPIVGPPLTILLRNFRI